MELWIRSQDKELFRKVENIKIEKLCYDFALINYEDNKNCSKLATYKTKKRALEVLDEIEQELKPIIINTSGIIVYEMPKE